MGAIKLPRGRNNYYRYFIPVLICTSFVAAYTEVDDIQEILCCLSSIVIAQAIGELILRVVMCVEEYFNLESRYENDIEKLLVTVFSCSYKSVFSVFVAFVVLFCTWKPQPPIFWVFICLSCAAQFIQPHLQLKDAPIYKSIAISTPGSVDIGASMAIGFFHGYLKILLPAAPSNDRGIKHMMDVYEAKMDIRFAKKALYILVPLSLSCPHRLTDMSSIMEEASTLTPIEEDRAGVKNRNYKNSVYKIKHKGGYIYVAAEYASPLKTFKESVNANEMFRRHYKYHKLDILWEFYKTIKKLVDECPDTKGCCEFIYYADYDVRGKPVDVGHVLLKRLDRDV